MPPARVALVLVIAIMAAPVAAPQGETLRTLVETSGHFHAGLVAVGVGQPAPGVGAINLARFGFATDACHPTLDFLLDYSPRNASASTPKASVEVLYEFRVELFDEAAGKRLAAMRFLSPGSARFELPSDMARSAPLRADLYMMQGAQVDWSLRVRGWLRHEGCALLSEVEADPPGAGAPWVELANPGFGALDVSGWTVRANGAPDVLVIPAGTSIPGDGRVVLALPLGFLGEHDEVVTLVAPDGAEYARTPPLTDASDDARTHQLVPLVDGAWVFADGSPGTP